MLSILADGEKHANEPSGEHTFNLDYHNRLTSDDYDIQSVDMGNDPSEEQ
jgi:hypothetical protein